MQAISAAGTTPLVEQKQDAHTKPDQLREVFHDFVGQTFYGQMFQAMRQTVHKSAYFDGGRAEEIFQTQLDQVLAEKMTDATAESLSDPMFELFQLSQR